MTPQEIAVRLAKDPGFKKLSPDRQRAVFQTSMKAGESLKAASSAPGYEQAQMQTEQDIASRPSSIGFLRDVAENPAMAAEHPFQTAFSALGAPFEAGESIPANVGLALQRGDVSQLPQELLQGMTGERPAQIGDVYRASGVPALQAMSASAGLLLTGGTGMNGLHQGSMNPGMRAAEEVMRPALRMADMIQKPTRLGTRMSEQVLGQVPMIAGKIGDTVVRPLRSKMLDPITQFPYRKSLELRQGMIRFFRNMNQTYGDEVDKLSSNLQGVLPTDQLSTMVKTRLQEVRILDLQGNLTPEVVSGMLPLNPIERKMVNLYEELATSPSPTVPFKDFLREVRHLRKTIRQTVRNHNQPINADERIVSGVLHDVAVFAQPNVQGPSAQSLMKINEQYAKDRTLFNEGNRVVKVFKGDYDTKSAERVMDTYYALDGGTQKLLDQLEAKTGVKFVQQAKALSAAKGIGQLPGVGGLAGGALSAGRLAGVAGRVMGAPFTAPGQIQQAVIRELTSLVGTPNRKRP